MKEEFDLELRDSATEIQEKNAAYFAQEGDTVLYDEDGETIYISRNDGELWAIYHRGAPSK